MKPRLAYAPAIVLALGALITVGVDGQRTMSLRAPLDATIPREIRDQVGRDLELPHAQQRAAGMTSYVLRAYSPTGKLADQAAAPFSVYVGYYPEQKRGQTIHSPKNCLPGAGWQALVSAPVTVETPRGRVLVNRYILQRGEQKALVLYWYQGRGRVEASEYRVKWNLLLDSALRRRSDEALVRVVVPIPRSQDEAFELAKHVAAVLMPAVETALPKA